MRDATATEAFAFDRYDQIRGLQQATQPNTDNVMLRNVNAAPVLPDVSLVRIHRGGRIGETGKTRMEGARLVLPQPTAANPNGLGELP
jgi:general secretion pathway protein D